MPKDFETPPSQPRPHIPLVEWEIVNDVAESAAFDAVNDPTQNADQIVPFSYIHDAVVNIREKNGQLKTATLRGIGSNGNETCFTQLYIVFPGLFRRVWAQTTKSEPIARVFIGNYDPNTDPDKAI